MYFFYRTASFNRKEEKKFWIAKKFYDETFSERFLFGQLIK